MSFSVSDYQRVLGSTSFGRTVLYVPQVDSTNSLAKHHPEPDVTHAMVVITDHQTAGRGQYQRSWLSAPAQNLTFSVVLTPGRSKGISLLKQVAALAVSDALTELGLQSIRIKWPNDVLVDHRKIAGILVEAVFKGASLARVVVGIGLNVHQTEFPEDVRYLATSVALAGQPFCTREEVLASVMLAFERRYGQWERMDPTLKSDIQRHVIGMGTWCQIRIDNVPQEEKVKPVGVDDDGQLIVVTEQLRPFTFTHQDVRIDRPAEPL
jgi:BirA family biotin operon repressor/biotin-[acetyl-CoA-carboxylase] ligase